MLQAYKEYVDYIYQSKSTVHSEQMYAALARPFECTTAYNIYPNCARLLGTAQFILYTLIKQYIKVLTCAVRESVHVSVYVRVRI